MEKQEPKLSEVFWNRLWSNGSMERPWDEEENLFKLVALESKIDVLKGIADDWVFDEMIFNYQTQYNKLGKELGLLSK